MSIFTGWNPFNRGSLIYNQKFQLQKINIDRGSQAESEENLFEIQDFVGSEPQMMQRVTENLVLIDNVNAMQDTLSRIFTQDKTLPDPQKGWQIYDTDSEKSYKILAFYPHRDGMDFVVSEKSH